ncbi:hypothetical protein SAMN05444266_10267 [Chitinophaga jiangningensis]|uniref:SWIM-type domain-containing protein n=1 Tax=Chitinophaga jiangningensis TaxID=1419482 RepID=A0A1M6XYB6_9BACT|nr:hypothetical protein [Chitinophaga jiangningensis]SHL10805.1 hypothetical protein SAMN05444266_10267 [Chitinophaga jiangningensis]
MVTAKSFPRSAAGTAILPLTKDYGISLEILKENCLDADLLTGIGVPTIKFMEYKSHQLTLNSFFPSNDYVVKFKIVDNSLQVVCSCKEKRPGTCLHAYKTIEAITGKYGKGYFSQLVRNNVFDLAFSYPASFDKEENERGISVKKRKEVMQLFPFEKSAYPLPLDEMLKLKVPPEVGFPAKRESLAFFVMLPHSGRQLPFLMPALGRLTIGNDKVLSWVKFLPMVESEHEKLMNVHQLDLSIKADQLREKSDALGEQRDYCREPNWDKQTQVIYNEWKKLFPMLQNEVFIYTYHYFGSRIFRRRPRPNKSNANRIAVCADTPVIYFKVTYTKERFQMDLGIKIKGKPISGFNISYPFFVIHQGRLYMFSTYQDAAIAQWYNRIGHICFFKEHKKDFGEAILTPLSEKYTIA